MAKPEKPFRIEVYKETPDDWYPSYQFLTEFANQGVPGNGYYIKLVKVSFLQFLDQSGWRVCVWGLDDFGMERDYGPDGRAVAWSLFQEVIAQEQITVSWLKEQGFVTA